MFKEYKSVKLTCVFVLIVSVNGKLQMDDVAPPVVRSGSESPGGGHPMLTTSTSTTVRRRNNETSSPTPSPNPLAHMGDSLEFQVGGGAAGATASSPQQAPQQPVGDSRQQQTVLHISAL